MFIVLKEKKLKICDEQVVLVISENLGHSKIIFLTTNEEKYVENKELTEIKGNIITIAQG